MITEREVKKAIEECLQDPITGNKRTALADLIIIQGYLFGDYPREQDPPTMRSMTAAPEPAENIIQTQGGTEFLDAVDGKKADRAWKLIDELVQTVKLLHPKMHGVFIEKLYDL